MTLCDCCRNKDFCKFSESMDYVTKKIGGFCQQNKDMFLKIMAVNISCDYYTEPDLFMNPSTKLYLFDLLSEGEWSVKKEEEYE